MISATTLQSKMKPESPSCEFKGIQFSISMCVCDWMFVCGCSACVSECACVCVFVCV